MSSKSRMKSVAKKPAPRSMEDLQKHYTDLCGQLGTTTFRIDMLNAQLTSIRKTLVSVINETQERRNLDAQTSTTQQPTQPTAEEVK